MKKSYTFLSLFLGAILGVSCCQEPKTAEPSMEQVVQTSLDYCVDQAKLLAQTLAPHSDTVPVGADWNGKLISGNSTWWTSGFYPGELWYLYEYSGDDSLKSMAELFTKRVEKEQYTTNNHDVGFIIFCSVGNQYRLTGSQDERLKEIIVTAAESLCTRYRPNAHIIQSWDVWDALRAKGWECPVIIDNMMNLELLEQASKLSGNPKYADIARTHANTTLANHFRPDGSCYHVVNYDPQTGKALHHDTWQGYSAESAWARGQAWALYGYTMMFRETGDSTYLKQAAKVAEYIVNHPNLPEDKIPYWDFNAPNIPDAYRDVSAGTVICSALIELSQYVPEAQSKAYLQVAEKQLRSLTSPFYRIAPGHYSGLLLKHSVGSLPHASEVDVPIIYADYYYVEALMRYKKLMDEGKI